MPEQSKLPRIASRLFYGFMRLCFAALLLICVFASFAVRDLWAALMFWVIGAGCVVMFFEARP